MPALLQTFKKLEKVQFSIVFNNSSRKKTKIKTATDTWYTLALQLQSFNIRAHFYEHSISRSVPDTLLNNHLPF